MLLLQPYISLNTSHWMGIFIIFLLCVGFISIYILIGLLVSSLSPSASQSVLFVLLIWIVLVFLYPNTVNYIVNSTVAVPSSDSMNKQVAHMREEISKEVSDKCSDLKQPDTMWGSYWSINSFGLTDRLVLSGKSGFEYYEKKVRRGIPIILDGFEHIYRVKQDYKRQLMQQKKTAGTFMSIMPGYLVEQSSTKIAGTHYSFCYTKFISHSKVLWNGIIDYVKSKDGFGLKYFSQIDRKDMREHYKDYTKEFLSKARWDKYPALEMPDIPVFAPPKRYIIPVESIKDLILLLMMNVVLFITGVYLFSRADIRLKI